MANEKTHLKDEVTCKLYGPDGKLKDGKASPKKESLWQELREIIKILFS